jgi:hypothetical protein
MKTLYINYTRTGTPIADCIVEEMILVHASLTGDVDIDRSMFWNVSTGNVIDAVRYMKLTGQITCDVKLMFEGQDVPMNENCRIENWPEGFCDYTEKWFVGIFKAQIAIYKKHKIE